MVFVLGGCGATGRDTEGTQVTEDTDVTDITSAGTAPSEVTRDTTTGEETTASETTSETTAGETTSPEETTAREETTDPAETTNQEETSGSEETSGQESGEDSGGSEGGSEENAERPSTETLVAGAGDTPGGVLTENRLVSYYGHPWSAAMGELGQYDDPRQMVQRLKEQASAYTEIDPGRPAIPTIELIASVAQGTPGADGLYLNRTPPDVIEEYARVAQEENCLLLLDVQIGYSSIEAEVEAIRPFLERPYVHLAIDPEYDMDAGEVPGQQFGSSSGEEIMAAARTLSRIVEENGLPPKVLVVHQFRYDMISNKQVIQPVENVQIVIHADGFGSPQQKFVKYRQLVTEQPIQYGGFKVFYDQDAPVLSPREVLENLNPAPAVVSYQ